MVELSQDGDPFQPAREKTVDELRAELKLLQERDEARNLQVQINKLKIQESMMVNEPPPINLDVMVPKVDPERDADTCWILMPEDAEECKLAVAWIQRFCPLKQQQRLIDDCINLERLREDDSVICLVRGKGRPNPMSRHTFVIEQGQRVEVPRSLEEMFTDVSLTAPVYCSDHWENQANGSRYSGKLNYQSFLEALGKACTPMRPAFRDAASRKAGEKPSELVLRAF